MYVYNSEESNNFKKLMKDAEHCTELKVIKRLPPGEWPNVQKLHIVQNFYSREGGVDPFEKKFPNLRYLTCDGKLCKLSIKRIMVEIVAGELIFSKISNCSRVQIGTAKNCIFKHINNLKIEKYNTIMCKNCGVRNYPPKNDDDVSVPNKKLPFHYF